MTNPDIRARSTEKEVIERILGKTEYKNGDLYWLESDKSNRKGRIAGNLNHGYRRIFTSDYGALQVHRAIFFLFHGFLPLIVDHIDGNPSNNHIDNLRAATRNQNQQNCKTSSKNTSGRKGVFWHKGAKKWTVSIRVNDKLKHIGTFDDFQIAVKAREEAEKKYHGEYTRRI